MLLLENLKNPLLFAIIAAVLSVILCYGNKCIFEEKTKAITYVKTFIMTYGIVVVSLYGFEFVKNFISSTKDKNLNIGDPKF
tara:strand:- start:4723 stop:4968 length:246 start_codon:yes stop_codon:yes gene_type:complete